MKILVISNMYPSENAPNYGTFVKNFCDQLEQLNMNFDKVVMIKESNKLASYFKYYFRVIANILSKKYDFIYVHYASYNALPILFTYLFKKIKIYTNVHGGDVIPQTKMQFRLQKYTQRLLQVSDKIIAPSEYFKNEVSEMYRIPRSKIMIYPSAGVNERLFYPYPEEEKDKIEINDFKPDRSNEYIGYVGRIERGKGWETFLRAIYLLKKNRKIKGKRFIIIGYGNEYSKFNEMIKEYDLSDVVYKIKYLPQSELPKVYNILSVFCFPTEAKESLGLVALEALACGVPVIASDYAAPKEYIIDGYNGFKFQKGNSEDLANKIDAFFNLENSQVKQLRENAHITGSKYYTKIIRNTLVEILK